MMEEIIMTIILNAGNARSKCLIALKRARAYQFYEAKMLIKEANESLNIAHKAQTKLIQNELNGKTQDVTLLMLHAQDHLMSAITIKDMACEMVAFVEEINTKVSIEKGAIE